MVRARTRALAAAGIGAALATILASCSAGTETVPAPIPPVVLTASGDGVLRIGTAFPSTGDLASSSSALVAAAEIAVRDINAAGGVAGVPVEALHRDSGDGAPDTLDASFADLTDRSVDALIGPSSAELIEHLLPAAVDVHMPVITPMASAPRLANLPDDGYLFRTVAPAGMQGDALAVLAGDTDVAIIHSGDDEGTAVQERLEVALEESGGTLVIAQKLTSASSADVAAAAASVTKANPSVVVIAVSSDTAATPTLITRLSAAGLGGAKLWLAGAGVLDYSATLPAGLMSGVRGVVASGTTDDVFVARLRTSDPTLTDVRFAAEAYDAVIIAALAAVVAEDDGGASIASRVDDVTTGGIACSSFGECIDVLETDGDIDYQGVSGPLELDESGDPLAGTFGVVEYAAENRPSHLENVVVGG